MVNNNEEKLNKNNEVSLEEAEVYLAEAEVAEAKEFIRDEEILFIKGITCRIKYLSLSDKIN